MMDLEKHQILKELGLKFNFDRQLYLDPVMKIALSEEYVADHPIDLIKNKLHAFQPNGSHSGWRFFFNEEASASVKKELNRILG